MRSLRTSALLATGAVTVHQLRYLLVAGGSPEPSAGHEYLPLAGLVAALLLAAALAQIASLLSRARRTGRRPPAGAGFLPTWLLASASLIAIFVVQELLEGALAEGRVSGLAAVLGGGGWVALPLALAVGALVALALAGARAAVLVAARGAAIRPARRSRYRRRPRLPSSRRPSYPALAGHLSARAPPVAS